MAEFSPDELDQIEDLLEDLEGLEDIDQLDLPEAARERLGDYQDILALSRDALPMQEPDPSLLAGVMAEARQGAFNATATAAGVVAAARESNGSNAEGQRRPWLARWLPALTLAASAAAVLLWMRPGQDADDEAAGQLEDIARADEASDEGLPTAVPDRKAEAIAPEDPPQPGAQDAEEAEPVEDTADPESVSDSAARADDPPRKRPGGEKHSLSTNKPKAEAAEEARPLDKDQAWEELTQAHALRLRGECRSARTLYRGLEFEGLKSNVRAQALAGRGLCAEFDGDGATAETLFSRARAIRVDIDGWIAAERQDMLANGHMRKKAPSKAKHRRPSKKSKKGL